MNIKNILTSFVISLGIVGAAGIAYNDPFQEAPPPLSEVYQSSVQIGDFCSGTVINDPDMTDGIQTTILTAKHCVNKVGDIITITIPDYIQDRVASKTDYKFTVVSISSESDLAILQMEVQDSFKIAPAVIYGGIVEFGDKVVSVSFPAGTSKTITEGYLGYIENVPPFGDVSKSEDFRRSSTMVTGGSSGGSLYRVVEYKGRTIVALVGVLTGGMGSAKWITYWTPLEEIQSYISSVDIDGVSIDPIK